MLISSKIYLVVANEEKGTEKGWAKEKKRNQFFAEFEKRVRQIPEAELSEDRLMKLTESLTTLFFVDDWGRNTQYYRFEIPYLEKELQEQIEIKKKNMPQNLKDSLAREGGADDVIYEFDKDIGRYVFIAIKGDRALYYDEYGNFIDER